MKIILTIMFTPFQTGRLQIVKPANAQSNYLFFFLRNLKATDALLYAKEIVGWAEKIVEQKE